MSRAALALSALALALTGCETTAEKSAQLEKAALRSAGHASTLGLRITHPSTRVRILSSVLVRGSEGYAAVVTLRNSSDRALREIPIAVEARDAHGAVVYSNTTPGEAHSLVSVPFLPPHGELTWVDDQVQGESPVTLKVVLGEGASVSGGAPAISFAGVKLFEDPASGPGAEGMVANGSTVAQHELVVYAVARKAGRIVAAGRGILPELAGGASARFQAYFVGSPVGAALQVSAPPTTLP